MNIELTAFGDHFKLRAAIAQGIMHRDDLQSVVDAFDYYLNSLVENIEDTAEMRLPTVFQSSSRRTPKIEEPAEVCSEAMSVLKAVVSECTYIPTSKIEPGDSVLSLGIDSIMALQVSSKLRRKGFSIGSAEIIESSSLRSLAARISGPGRQQNNGDVIIANRTPLRGSKPLEPTAGIMWFIGASLSGDSGSFQHAFPYQVLGKRLDSARARAAWRSLVSRHVLLRTGFICDGDGNIELSVAETSEPNWSEISYNHIFEETPWIQRFLYDLIDRPLDPTSPPSRCTLIHLGNYDYLIFELHHFQYGKNPLHFV
jgi:ferricrocin synthase